MAKQVTLRVKRYRPEKDGEPYYQEYTILYSDDMVLLDALNYIKDEVDPTLTFRWSCRMGICGSCGASVNGRPVLTCGVFIKDFRRGTIVVDPMANFPILKDLVVDIEDFMHKLHGIRPFILRTEDRPLAEGEYLQTPEEVEAYRQQSMCINCMLCYSACPIYGGDSHFVGPAASALAYRYIRDSRDEASDARIGRLSTKAGIWECTFVGECSTVCPKDVDPAGAIQNLKVLASLRHVRKMLMPKSLRR